MSYFSRLSRHCLYVVFYCSSETLFIYFYMFEQIQIKILFKLRNNESNETDVLNKPQAGYIMN